MFKFLGLSYIHVNLQIPSGRDGGFSNLYKFTFYHFGKVRGDSFNIKNFGVEIDLRDQHFPTSFDPWTIFIVIYSLFSPLRHFKNQFIIFV